MVALGQQLETHEQRAERFRQRSIDAEKQGLAGSKAVLRVSKTGNENVTEAFKDNAVLDYAGVSARDLDASQRARLTSLIRLYVDNMDDGHAKVKMDEVARHMDRTWFAWIGQADAGPVPRRSPR